MVNPWLNLPLHDYEAHMGAPDVAQLGALSDLFRSVLEIRNPASVAVLGIAGGNGLEHIDQTITKRIVGVDFNPLYLHAVKSRFPHFSGLELKCIDLTEQLPKIEPVELVHAALIFEHTGIGRCLTNAASLVSSAGALSVVLQMPSDQMSGVSQSPISSIQQLASHFSLIEPSVLTQHLQRIQLRLISEIRRPLPYRKSFWMGIFVRK